MTQRLVGMKPLLRLRPGMDLVLGSEISCQAEGGFSVHMLGLLFDKNEPTTSRIYGKSSR
jgi:hypothetical protein